MAKQKAKIKRGVAPILRKGGVHQKSKSALRQKAKRALKKEEQ